MNRTIKTRQAVLSVKTADHKKNLSHYMKQSLIRSKPIESRNSSNTENGSSPSANAIENIQTTWKRSFYESGHRLKQRQYTLRSLRNAPDVETIPSKRPAAVLKRGISTAVRNNYQIRMMKHTVHRYTESIRNYNYFTRSVSNTISSAGVILSKTFVGLKTSITTVSNVFSFGIGVLCLLTMTTFFGVFSTFTNTTVIAEGIEIPEASVQPDFTNEDAWGDNNPYTRLGFTGQCTWFAWGRFYEIYGYSPGFTGDGWSCASQLVAAHPERFELSYYPAAGAVFSTIGHNHVGIVISVDGNQITIQDGNQDGVSNPFIEAITDWREVTYDIDAFVEHHGGVIYAVPIQSPPQ